MEVGIKVCLMRILSRSLLVVALVMFHILDVACAAPHGSF